MSFGPRNPGDRGSTQLSRRRPRALVPTLVVLAVLGMLFGVFAGLYTDLLWFRSVEFTKVYTTELTTRLLLFVVFGLTLAGLVVANFVLAYRARPAYNLSSPEQANLDRYRMGVDPFRRLVLLVAGAILALMGGTSGASNWQQYLLWRHGVDFGVRDQQFNRDVSFFTFDLPFYRYVLGFLFAAVILSLMAAVVTHYLYGGIKLQSPGDRTTPGARMHLSVLLGLFVLLKAVAYWLDRYALATKEGRVGQAGFTGMTYTDVNALVPAKVALAVIALLCALLFFGNVFLRTWLLPGIAAPLLLLSAVIMGGIVPAFVQTLQVKPNESDKEREYIARNIAATRAAYSIDATVTTEYEAASADEAAQAIGATVPNVRLVDPVQVPETFRQLQQNRNFYAFPDPLDVDRYMIDGKEQDAVVAVREINVEGVPQRNWINDRIVYTHGFGFVAAKGNARTSEGLPSFLESEIPPIGGLGEYEPRVYFGEQSPTYSIVGGPAGTDREFDYPDAPSNYTYKGKGGVPVGSLLNRTLFALRFQDGQIVLSTEFVRPESKILYIREPRERVQKVAPWLTLDADPYPAVVDGRIVWIVDGYTTSASYPYSRRTSLDDATDDALTGRAAVAAQAQERVNYIRNSVKATVDAYDGTVSLYAWDEKDPVLQTWRKAFPGTVKDRSAISPGLLAHLRYPEDLFKVQRTLLAEYHVTDPNAFYNATDFWRVPPDPVSDDPGTGPGDDDPQQPAYYLTLQMPGQKEPTFSLSTAYIPRSAAGGATARANLTAFAAVQAEPGEGYGTIRLLRVPARTIIPGPPQVFNNFQSDAVVAEVIRNLKSGTAEVEFGNLLTLPVGGGLLYVQPVYVRGAGGQASYPLLQRVIVGFNDRVAIDSDLERALERVLGKSTSPPPPDTGGTPQPGTENLTADARRALNDAFEAQRQYEAAVEAGDVVRAAQAQVALNEALKRAQEALARGGRPTTSPSPSPGGSPTPPPTAGTTAAASG